jgi:cytochrome P450 family 135
MQALTEPTLPPGPPLPGAVQTVAWGLRPWRFFDACRRRYGSTFTIRFYDGTPIVVLSNPDDIRAVFALGGDEFEANRNSEVLEPFLGSRSVLLLDGDDHRDERRRLQHAFRAERLETYRRLVVGATLADMAHWPVDRPFAIHDRTRAITLEVILRAVFGAAVEAELLPLRAALGTFLAESSGSLLALAPPLRYDFGPRSPWGKFVRQRDAVHAEVWALIARRRSAPDVDTAPDILSALLVAGCDGQSLLDQLMTMVLAGHDTTATALAWAFDLLLHHPIALDRLRSSVRAGDDAYLDAVVHEVLRLRPVLGEVARTVLVPFASAAGELPPETALMPSIYLAHTDPDRYPTPFDFQPERFLDQAPDLVSWLPFGGGTRRCLGVGLAMLELREVLRTVVNHADLRGVDPSMERPRRRAVTVMPRHGCRVELVARPKIEAVENIR